MKLIETKCKKCGANLEIDVDHLQAYCQYCGAKLLLDINDLGALLSEKERTKQSKNDLYKEKEKTKQTRIRHQAEIDKNQYEYQLKSDRQDTIKNIIIMILCILFLFVFIPLISKLGLM